MWLRFLHFLFYGNYYIGLIAIVLTFETCLQLRLPFPDPLYFITLFCGSIVYYTYAYVGQNRIISSPNPRDIWLSTHSFFIRRSQIFLLAISIISGSVYLLKGWDGFFRLPLPFWLVPGFIVLVGLLYYGLFPASLLSVNLRNTGWIKSFAIGFVWASCVGLVPIMVAAVESDFHLPMLSLAIWLFVKNWMFCTVNAIMFDIKDYAADSNQQLKTFVVRYGLRKTIFLILMPLLLVGFISFLVVTHANQIKTIPVLFNLIPFLLFIRAAWSLHLRRSLLYYLVVIDGIILLKACCGMLGSLFV